MTDNLERPPSISSDEAVPLTPILKKTNRDYPNVCTYPTVQEVAITSPSPTRVTTYVTSFGSTSPTTTQVFDTQKLQRSRHKSSPPPTYSSTFRSSPPYTSPLSPLQSPSSSTVQQLQAKDVLSPSYYDTFVMSYEESPPPDSGSSPNKSPRDLSEEPYDYTTNTRFFVEDSVSAQGSGDLITGSGDPLMGSSDLMTDSEPNSCHNSPHPNRFEGYNPVYNSTESELISDGEDAGESTELLPLGRSQSQKVTGCRQHRTHKHVRRASTGSSGSPASGNSSGSSGNNTHQRFRRRPESQPLLMRPEVLKLRKTTC